MSLPTTATDSIEIAAPGHVVYDLIADVTRMCEWSPECVSCEWLDDPGQVGSTFRGRNRNGLARWSTVARVLTAERPRTFSFATLHRGQVATRWTYHLVGDERTRLTESFEAVSTPRLFGVLERLVIRDRQQQLESGIARTLAAVKAAAEHAAHV
jgi:hypothetical protein